MSGACEPASYENTWGAVCRDPQNLRNPWGGVDTPALILDETARGVGESERDKNVCGREAKRPDSGGRDPVVASGMWIICCDVHESDKTERMEMVHGFVGGVPAVRCKMGAYGSLERVRRLWASAGEVKPCYLQPVYKALSPEWGTLVVWAL